MEVKWRGVICKVSSKECKFSTVVDCYLGSKLTIYIQVRQYCKLVIVIRASFISFSKHAHGQGGEGHDGGARIH